MDRFARIGFPDWSGIVEILCLAVVLYYVLRGVRGTRAAPVFTGLVLVFVLLAGVTRFFHLETLNWLLGRFSVYLTVAVLVIFQPEIRRVLGALGKRYFSGGGLREATLTDQLVATAGLLAKRRIGALIAVERSVRMRAVLETGVPVEAVLTPELLASIFFPYAPLHDGGVIISEGRIAAARCIFPAAQRIEPGSPLGTRHQAAIGLTEESDAVVVVVSEETGKISVAYEGRLLPDMSEAALRRFLSGIFSDLRRPRAWWQPFLSVVQGKIKTARGAP